MSDTFDHCIRIDVVLLGETAWLYTSKPIHDVDEPVEASTILGVDAVVLHGDLTDLSLPVVVYLSARMVDAFAILIELPGCEAGNLRIRAIVHVQLRLTNGLTATIKIGRQGRRS